MAMLRQKRMKDFIYNFSVIIAAIAFVFYTAFAIVIYNAAPKIVTPCPNCHLKDSLYYQCNGDTKRMNRLTNDTLR